MKFAYWWSTRVTKRWKLFLAFATKNANELAMLVGWVLVTWSIVTWSVRGWAASMGLYFLALVAIEAMTAHYTRLRVERNKGPQ